MNTVFELLALAGIAALVACGGTLIMRTLPGFSKLVRDGVRPFACDLCMSFWLSYVFCCVQRVRDLVDWYDLLFVTVAAVPLSMWLLRRLSEPTTDFDLPPDGEAP